MHQIIGEIFGRYAFLKSIKPSSHEMEKEINSSIPHWHPSCIANRMIITISDCPIPLHFSNHRVIAVSDSAITLYFTQI